MEAGDEMVSASTLYGGTYTQFDVTFRRLGYNVKFVEPDDPENFRKAITPKTRLLYGETISNPRGNVLDIEAVAKIAHEHNMPLMIDNTFATPYLCRPIDFGADIVVHSLTKFMGGHGNRSAASLWTAASSTGEGQLSRNQQAVAGLSRAEVPEVFGPIAFIIRAGGGPPRPGSVHQPVQFVPVLQGIETLGMRMDRHVSNTKRWRSSWRPNAQVTWVKYPSLPEPILCLAQKYMPKGAGAVFSFGIKGGYDAGPSSSSTASRCSRIWPT
jgi:O-acetylhomoserine (thiol)-lyase